MSTEMNIKLKVNFSQASSRQNITSGENIVTSFGKISKYLNDLGDAAYKDYTTSVTQGSGDLVTSGAVYNALQNSPGSPLSNVGYSEEHAAFTKVYNDETLIYEYCQNLYPCYDEGIPITSGCVYTIINDVIGTDNRATVTSRSITSSTSKLIIPLFPSITDPGNTVYFEQLVISGSGSATFGFGYNGTVITSFSTIQAGTHNNLTINDDAHSLDGQELNELIITLSPSASITYTNLMICKDVEFDSSNPYQPHADTLAELTQNKVGKTPTSSGLTITDDSITHTDTVSGGAKISSALRKIAFNATGHITSSSDVIVDSTPNSSNTSNLITSAGVANADNSIKTEMYLEELPYKNLLENTHEHNISEKNGVRYNNSFFYGGSITDCRIAVTQKVDEAYDMSWFDVNTNLTLQPGTYILTGCPSGGSDATYKLRAHLVSDVNTTIADDFGSGSEFTLTQTTEIGVRIYVYVKDNNIEKAFYPMICTKFLYDINSAYVPFTKRIGRADQYGVVKLSDSILSTSGEGNGIAATPLAVKTIKDILFDYNNKNFLTLTNSDILYEGIRYTPNYNDENGAVRVYRVSQSSNKSIYHISTFSKTLGTGQYILTGCPSDGSNSTYRLFAYYISGEDAIQVASDTGSGAEFTLTEQKDVRVRIEIASSVTNIDKIFRPMICLKSVYDVDSTFVPGININANDDRSGVVKLSDKYNVPVSASSGGVACTTKGVKDAYDDAINKGTRTGNASTKGQVQLYDGVDSSSDTDGGIAATPKAVKLAYDKANAGLPYKNFVCVKRTDSSVGTGIIYEVISDRTSPDCGKVLVSGNKTSDSYYDVSDIPILLTSGTYMLSGCPSGGSSTSYRLNALEYNNLTLLATDMGSGKQFTLASTTAIIVRINISANTNIPSTNKLVFSPMVCLKSVYDIDNSFVPGRIPMGSDCVYGMVKLSDNYALDSNSVEGIAATPLAVKSVYTIASSAGTKANNAYATIADCVNKNYVILNRNYKQDNGVTFSPLTGPTLASAPTYGQVQVNGTSSGTSFYDVVIENIILDAGTYVLSGCPSGGSSTTYRLHAHDASDVNTTIADDFGDSATFTLSQRTAIGLRIYVYSGAGKINVYFAPMICKKSVYDIDQSFEANRVMYANGEYSGVVKLSDAIDSEAGTDLSHGNGGVAATPLAVKNAYDLASSASTEASNAYTVATTKAQSNVFGIVELTDVADVAHNASESIASTPTAVKKVWDKANAGMLYKNLLCVRRTESSYLYNNIHYDVVSDQSANDCGYIYVYGDNNGAASDVSYYVVNDRQVYLDPGEYILTGCPSGGSTTTYRLRAHNVVDGSIAIADDVGSGATFTVTSRIAVQVRIYIYPAAGSIPVSSKKVFTPMICLKSAYDASSSFVSGRFPVGTDVVYGMVKLTDTADVDHDAYEGIAASATAVHKAYSLANTANTAASTANASLSDKVQTLGYQTDTSPYFYYNKDGSSTKTSFCSMATSVSSSSNYPVTSKAVASHLSSNYYTASTVDSEINNAISDRPQVVYCQVTTEPTGTSLAQVSGLSFTTNGNYTYRITASLSYTKTKTSEISIWTTNGYCWAQALNNGSTDIGVLTCTALMSSMARTIIVKAKSQASGNNVVALLVEKLPIIS